MAKISPVCGIYKITSPTNRVYIGQSINIPQRFQAYSLLHKVKSQPGLYNSFAKHGIKNHTFEIIHEMPVGIDQLTLNYYEQFYMDWYRCLGIRLMNVREGGSNGRLNESTRLKIGKANKISLKGNKPPTTGKSMIEYFGKERADELKKRISDTLKGRPLSRENIEKRKNYYKQNGHHRKGAVASEETKLKQSLAKKGKPGNRKGWRKTHNQLLC